MTHGQDTVVPALNEGTVIGSVVEGVLEHCLHVVCVIDGTTGRSAETGIEFARLLPGVTRFVTFDADGQHRVEDALSLVRLTGLN